MPPVKGGNYTLNGKRRLSRVLLVHADRHQVVLDGVGNRRCAAVGERDRRSVRAQHGIEVNALWRGLQRREQPLGGVGVELLDIGHFAVAELRKFAAGHERARLGVLFFEIFHRLSTPSWSGHGEATFVRLIMFQSAATIPIFITRFCLAGRVSSMARSPLCSAALPTSTPMASAKLRLN